MHPDAYAVLAAKAETEIRIKGSRFLAKADPVTCEADAQSFLLRMRDTHPDASHHCWAMRIGPPEAALERFSDDGEPGGSAGPPIARAIASSELSDLICVVIRWFGGTKLGVGGLIRAYGQAARDCLAAAERGELLHRVRLAGSFSYELEPQLRSLLARGQGRIGKSEYDDMVSWLVEVPPSFVDEFKKTAADLSRGRFEFLPVEDEANSG